MKDYLFSPIKSDFVAQCHELNEQNVPNVGTKSLDEFINLIENSDSVSYTHLTLPTIYSV